MVLVVPDLAQHLGVDAATPRLHEALEAAEAMVAASLGAATLDARTVAVTLTIARGAARVLHLADGPATALDAVTIDGAGVTDGAIHGYWGLRRATGLPFVGTTAEVVYTAGWSRQTLPAPVRQALLLTAASVHARADLTVTDERTAGVSLSYAADSIPAVVLAMLAPYRRPSLG